MCDAATVEQAGQDEVADVAGELGHASLGPQVCAAVGLGDEAGDGAVVEEACGVEAALRLGDRLVHSVEGAGVFLGAVGAWA